MRGNWKRLEDNNILSFWNADPNNFFALFCRAYFIYILPSLISFTFFAALIGKHQCIPSDKTEQKILDLLSLPRVERDVQQLLLLKGDPTKRGQGLVKKEMVGEKGSKSAFEALMRKPNKGGAAAGSSNLPRVEG